MAKETKGETRPERNMGAIILPRSSGVPKVVGIRRDPLTGKILPPQTPGIVRCRC
jgi:hypothetical protein